MWWPFKKKSDPVTQCIVKTILDDLRIYYFDEWRIENNRYFETFSHPKVAYELVTESTRHNCAVHVRGITTNFLSSWDQTKIWCELKRIRKMKEEREIDLKANKEMETLKTLFPKCFKR